MPHLGVGWKGKSRSMNENVKQVDLIILWNIFPIMFIYLHWQYNVSLSRLEEKVTFILSYSRTKIITSNWWDYFSEVIWENSFVYSYMRKLCFMKNQSEEFDHLQSNGITNIREIKRRLALNPPVCNNFHYWIDYWYG